jgi:hypothetical protein
VVRKVLSDVTYRVQSESCRSRRPVVHFNRLKPYFARDPAVGESLPVGDQHHIRNQQPEDTRQLVNDRQPLDAPERVLIIFDEDVNLRPDWVARPAAANDTQPAATDEEQPLLVLEDRHEDVEEDSREETEGDRHEEAENGTLEVVEGTSRRYPGRIRYEPDRFQAGLE